MEKLKLPIRGVRPSFALTGLLVALGGAATLAHGRLVEQAPAVVRAQLDALESRLGLRIGAQSISVDGWRSVALKEVVIAPAAGPDRPLVAVSEVVVSAGADILVWPPRITPTTVRVDGATLRVGSDLLKLLDKEGTGRRTRHALRIARGAAPGAAAAVRIPDIEILDAALLVDRPKGAAERWKVPLVTLTPVGDGRLAGRAELDAGPGMPFSVGLSGRVSRDGVSLQVEAPTTLRPPIMAEWLGRSVGFKAMQLDGAGLTLREVEVSVPSGQGMEVMARLPTLRVRLPGRQFDEPCAQTFNLFLDNRAYIVCFDACTQTFGGGDRLQARDAGADHEYFRRCDGPGGRHHHGENLRALPRREDDGHVSCHVCLRT